MKSHLLTGAVALMSALAAPLAHADLSFDECMRTLRSVAPSKGVSQEAFDRFTAGVSPDETVLESLDYQPEFVTPIWDYMASLVDEERIDDGRAMLTQWSDVLERVEAEYGVDRHTVVAVWGVESNYGKNFGSRLLVTSLATGPLLTAPAASAVPGRTLLLLCRAPGRCVAHPAPAAPPGPTR